MGGKQTLLRNMEDVTDASQELRAFPTSPRNFESATGVFKEL